LAITEKGADHRHMALHTPRAPRQLRSHIILTLGALFLGLPVVILFVSATHEGGLSGRSPVSLLPGNGFGENLRNLREVIVDNAAGPTLGKMVLTSFSVATGVALLTTISSFLAAFAMTFLSTRGTRIWFGLTIATLYFPIEARMLSTFEVTARLGLVNALPGMVLPILPLALGTFFFCQHLRKFPPEYLEAARLDGAGVFRFLVDFALPLSKGPIAAVLAITFVIGWNQYLWPLMVSVDNSLFTLMQGLNLLGAGTGPSMSLAALSILPPLVLLYIFQRRISKMSSLQI
jgi:sn-glycerol 3-phosphate transport system permease protein